MFFDKDVSGRRRPVTAHLGGKSVLNKRSSVKRIYGISSVIYRGGIDRIVVEVAAAHCYAGYTGDVPSISGITLAALAVVNKAQFRGVVVSSRRRDGDAIGKAT